MLADLVAYQSVAGHRDLCRGRFTQNQRHPRLIDGNIDAQVFDSTSYYLYGMSDIMADSSFVKAFKAAQSNSLASTQNKSKNAGLLPSIPDLKNKNIALVEPDVEILESSKKTLRTMDLIKDNSTDLILQEAVYFNPRHDITDRVLNGLNSQK